MISFTEALILEQVNRDYRLVKEAQQNDSGAGESVQPSVTLAGVGAPVEAVSIIGYIIELQ